ncbi:MAG: DNA alkylation repair protein [Bacilli bacterium]|nr:DNA alkylation repair protein [Bacilli bacterium]
MNQIRKKLFELSELKYKEFSTKICVSKNEVIGVRLPYLRNLAKTIDYHSYLRENHTYFEEIMLEGMVIGNINNLDESINYIKKFVPKIDNWSICDSFCSSLKITKKNKEKMFDFIINYKSSNSEFEIRFLIVMLLNYYIDNCYINKIFEIINDVNKKDYYVKMAISWLLSVCFIKEEDKTYEYLKNNNLDDFIINKTISKISDSYRVEKYKKSELKKLRK